MRAVRTAASIQPPIIHCTVLPLENSKECDIGTCDISQRKLMLQYLKLPGSRLQAGRGRQNSGCFIRGAVGGRRGSTKYAVGSNGQ